jgi:hypothetical protein
MATNHRNQNRQTPWNLTNIKNQNINNKKQTVDPADPVAVKIKVKVSRNRPSVAQRVPGVLGSQISWQSAQKGGEVVNLTHRSSLPPGNVPGTHFH